ncbi:ThiS family protein [Thermodesulfobacteriota bacterium]
MGVKIVIPLFLSHHTDGVNIAGVTGDTVGECLDDFVKQFPLTKKLLFDKESKLFGHIEIFVNDISTFPEELNKPVNDGDTISMLYLMVGG